MSKTFAAVLIVATLVGGLASSASAQPYRYRHYHGHHWRHSHWNHWHHHGWHHHWRR